MNMECALDITVNTIVFLSCIWAVLSRKVDDGIMIKMGLTVMAFVSLHNVIAVVDLGESPHNTVSNLGMALIAGGIFLKVEVYSRLKGTFMLGECLFGCPMVSGECEDKAKAAKAPGYTECEKTTTFSATRTQKMRRYTDKVHDV